MKNTIIISLASLAIVGCGKGRSNNPFRALATMKKAPELQGSYETKCASAGEGFVANAINVLKGNTDAYPKSKRREISFHGDAATIKEVHYLGGNCDGGEAYAFEEKGTFKVGDKDKNEMNNAGRNLDIHMNTVDAMILSEPGQKFADNYGLCGKKDWKVSERVDVTAMSADGNCYDVTSKRTIANVYQVDNNELKLGYTGDHAVASDARPTSIDNNNTFVKKH